MKLDLVFPDGRWVSKDEFLVRCPFCGDHPSHSHCYINVKKQKFYCHYCDESGSVKKLLNKAGVSAAEIAQAKARTKDRIIRPINVLEFPAVDKDNGVFGLMSYNYLKERGMTDEEIEQYDVRFGLEGRFWGRVIFPIKEEGVPVCFVARSFVQIVSPKYLYPCKGETTFTASEVLFNYDQAKQSTEVVVVEGVFDALAVNRKTNKTGMALLGSNMSKKQLIKILSLPKHVKLYVCLDRDATAKAIVLLRELWAREREARLVILNAKDPDVASADDLNKAFNQARPYDILLERQVVMQKW